MKLLVLCMLCMVFLLAVTKAAKNDSAKLKTKDFDEEWSEFKATYDKKYSTDSKDKKRKDNFKINLKKVKKHNKLYEEGSSSYLLGVNEFSDLSAEEFDKTMNTLDSSKATTTTENEVHLTGAASTGVDWRAKGVVTPVKNQGQCGSCYAFSAIGALESQLALRLGDVKSQDLSEQNIVDCSQSHGNAGCNGGWMENSYNYVIANRGVDTEESYRYIATRSSKCMFSPRHVGAVIRYYNKVKRDDELALQLAVSKIGPVAVAIHATGNFQSYRSGIFDDSQCSKTQVNHAVLVVGYGTDSKGRDYWIVKNSWGTGWGMAGYTHMSRNKGNQCLIARYASFPVPVL